jgi:hypothetical protein
MMLYLQALALAITLGWSGTSALAQASNCAERSILVERLASTFGETRIGVGYQGQSGALIELFAVENGTWTIVLSLPSGVSCVVAVGEVWQTVPADPGPKGDPT